MSERLFRAVLASVLIVGCGAADAALASPPSQAVSGQVANGVGADLSRLAASGGAATLQTASIQAASVQNAVVALASAPNRGNRTSVAESYRTELVPTFFVNPGWTGNTGACTNVTSGGQPPAAVGTMSSAASAASLKAVNYFRAMVGLPAVTLDTTLSSYAQQAALYLKANSSQILTHFPDPSRPCYSPDAAIGAGGNLSPLLGNGTPNRWMWAAGNISEGSAPMTVGLYIDDTTNISDDYPAGHRLSILDQRAIAMGVGSADRYSALPLAGKPVSANSSTDIAVTWPSAGYFPWEIVPKVQLNPGTVLTSVTDGGIWSYQPKPSTVPSGGLSSSLKPTVTVTKNGTALAVTSIKVSSGSVTWRMPGLSQPSPGAEDTYRVTISGLPMATPAYEVKVIQARTAGVASVTVSGTLLAGSVLTATIPESIPSNAAKTYQWYRGTSAISGATSQTYKLVAADAGAKVSVKVTVSAGGYATSQTTSAGVTIALGVTSISTLTFTGKAELGAKLSAVVQASPSGAVLSYQWLRGGAAIAGATKSSYVLTAQDLGTKVSLSLIARATGYKTGATKTSSAIGPILSPRCGAVRFVTPAQSVTLVPDMTGDGRGEVLAIDRTGQLIMWPGSPGGKLGKACTLTTGMTGYTVYGAGDLNSDGIPDLLARDSAGRLWLYAGLGGEKLAGPKQVSSGWKDLQVILPGDVTGDNKRDLIGIDLKGQGWLYPGNGNGAFGARRAVSGVGWWPAGVTFAGAGDVNRDGRADILGVDKAGQLLFYAGNGNGYFTPRGVAGWGWTSLILVAGADIDGDGVGDGLALHRRTRTLAFFPGSGSGGFRSSVTIGTNW